MKKILLSMLLFCFITNITIAQFQNDNIEEVICIGTRHQLPILTNGTNFVSLNTSVFTLANSNSAIVTGVGQGIGEIQYLSNNGTTYKRVVKVLPLNTSLSLQVQPEFANLDSVCQGNMLRFIATPTPNNSNWSVIASNYASTPFVFNNNTVFNPNTYSSGTILPYTQNFWLSDGNGCSSVFSIGVKANSVPILTPNSTNSPHIISTSAPFFNTNNPGVRFCSNDITTNLINSQSGGSWVFSRYTDKYEPTGASTSINLISNSTSSNTTNLRAIDLITSNGTGSIVYKITDSTTGCYRIAGNGYSVVPSPLAVANITGTTSICVGGNTTLSTTSNGGSWASSNNNIVTVTNGLITGINAGIATISYTIINANGCTSSNSITITVKPTTSSTTNASICQSALPYTWNGLIFNAAGSQTAHFTNSVGCDSAATLNLTIKPNTTSTTNVTVCEKDLPYTWNSTSYSANGSYTFTTTNSVGCDSTATLNLIIEDCGCKDTCNWSTTGNNNIQNHMFIGTRNGADFVVKTGTTNSTNNPLTERIRVTGTGAIKLNLQSNNTGTSLPIVVIGADGTLYKASQQSSVAQKNSNPTTPSQTQKQIEELQTEVAILKEQIKELLNAKIRIDEVTISENKLYQNTPNPFNSVTKIEYVVTSANNNFITIASLDGKQLKTIKLTTNGKGIVELNAGSLRSGTYTYSLYANGVLVDTKLMVISK